MKIFSDGQKAKVRGAYTGRWDGWEMPSWKAVSGK